MDNRETITPDIDAGVETDTSVDRADAGPSSGEAAAGSVAVAAEQEDVAPVSADSDQPVDTGSRSEVEVGDSTTEQPSVSAMETVNEDQMETDRHPIPPILRLRQEVLEEKARAAAAAAGSGADDELPRAPEGEALAHTRDVLGRLRGRIRAQVLGRDEVIDLVLVALLADGHVLLEDFPGSGKTTLAKSLGTSIIDATGEAVDGAPSIAPFRRIQFTPDLLPSDVTGVSVFDATNQTFQFRQGPIFAHVVLADEINRTSPKVQAAMLEAMAEKQVTVDNVTYGLDPLFFVIATQNPLDLAGTYPLPVAQLDRFLFKIRMHHIDRQSELEVLDTWRDRRDVERRDLPRVSRDDLLAARREVDEHVAIDDRIKEALVDIAQIVRADDRVLQGCSTRSLVLILPALQALAALKGRDYVSTDDLVTLIPRVLGHRLELAPGLSNVDDVIDDALAEAVEGLSRSTLRRR